MTINELAREFAMQPYELRAWADDLLDGMADDTAEIPAETEAIIRAAMKSTDADA